MKSFGLGSGALGGGVALALLAGCGGPQPPIGATGAMAKTSAIATHAERGKSWMLPEAKSKDLIYVNGDLGVYVYTYPQGQFVGELNPGFFKAYGECADASGDIFVVSLPNQSSTSSTIYEYAHGGTSPIAILSDPNVAWGCAVDPTTGNLAASGNGVAVYEDASGNPTIYSSSEFSFEYCGYDDRGNLYLSSVNKQSGDVELSRLSGGSSSFEQISLSAKLYANPIAPSVQWDGRHLALSTQRYRGYPVSVYRLRIAGSGAKIVSTAELSSTKNVYQGQLWIAGDAIFSVYAAERSWDVGLWPYPHGGSVKSAVQITHGRDENPNSYGLALSMSVPR